MKLIFLTTVGCCWTILLLGQSKPSPESWLEQFFREQTYAIPSVLLDNTNTHFTYTFRHRLAHDSLVMEQTSDIDYLKRKEHATVIHEYVLSWQDVAAWHYDKVYGTRITFMLFPGKKFRMTLLQPGNSTLWSDGKEFETPATLPLTKKAEFIAKMEQLVKGNIARRKGTNAYNAGN